MTASGRPSLSSVEILLADDFAEPVEPGALGRTRAASGSPRHVFDSEGTLGVDHGQLRIGWFEHAGWGRAGVVYGPFDSSVGISLAVRATNGLTTSQTDPRPEGRRAKLRRWRATFPRWSFARPTIRESMVIGWFADRDPRRARVPIAAVMHRAGVDATGEVWFVAGVRETRLANGLQNLPATYAIELQAGRALLYAWARSGAHAFAELEDETPIAELKIERPPSMVHAAIHQVVLGEVDYRVDTRVDAVRVIRGDGVTAGRELAELDWECEALDVAVADHFDGPPDDLDGSNLSSGGAIWQRVMGTGVLERTGDGSARVRASVTQPNPGRTIYVVPWSEPAGVEVAAVVTPPGTARDQGHMGRSGLVLWQDAANHLVVNHFIDDGSVGVSISAFLRTGGHEKMFDWDATWSNVGQRIQWGRPFHLSIMSDGARFLCRVDGEPVLDRAFTDYRRSAKPLRISGVGLAANWEWGDDTGTRFDDFTVRRIRRL